MYRLPSERIGRMIKVKRAELINAVLTVFTIIAVICGTCSIYSLADSDSTTDSIVFKDAAVLAENFNVYHGESAVTAGLSAAEPEKYFSVVSRIVKHTCTSTGNHTSGDYKIWDAQDDVVTTALYRKQAYRNFEMTAEFRVVPANWQVLPKLIFGVQDPMSWVNAEGGGYSVWLYNEGIINLKGITDGEYKTQSDNTDHTKTGEYGSLALWSKVTVRVMGKAVTVTVKQGTKAAYSEQFTLGDDYYGGKIGFAAGTGGCQFRNFSVTDLGGDVVPMPIKEYIGLSNFEDMKKFDCYYAESIKNGMKLVENYTDYWQHKEDGSIWRNPDTLPRVEYDEDLYTSTLVYNVKQYKYFELTVNMQRKESGGYGYMYPGVIFGIKNPGNFAYYKDGGYFCYATAEGALCVRANDFSAVTQAPAGYSRETVHTMTISVRYGRVTVKISGDGNNPEQLVEILPEDYTGGYIALVGMANVCGLSRLSVKEVEGELKNVSIARVKAPTAVEVETGVLPEDLKLPESVKIVGSDNEEYTLNVEWSRANYNRFVRGEYTLIGSLSPLIDYDKHSRVIIGDSTAEIKVRVKGKEDLSPVRVACVGDSITYASGTEQGYPWQMRKLLGGKYDIENFGVDGATLLKSGDNPYTSSSAFTASKAFAPNIVVIMLGTNDSKPQNWSLNDSYADDYKALIAEYKALPSNPTVYVALSPAVATDNYDISAETVKNEIVPLQREIAKAAGCDVIDIYSLTEGHSLWYADGVHPTKSGYGFIAAEIAKRIVLPGPLESFTLGRESDYIFEGETETYYPCFSPAKITGDDTVKWSTSDSAVADVKNGVVSARKKGSAVITAECQGKTAAVRITVYGKDDEISLPLTSSDDTAGFDCYYADDAERGLEIQNSYSPFWEISEKGIARTKETVGDMKWGEKYLSSLLFAKRKYHNFELTVDIQRDEVGEYNYPMVVFGIKNPAEYITKSGGGLAVFPVAEGTPMFLGQINGKYTNIVGKEPAAGYNRTGVHTLKLTVEYNTVTMSVTGADGESLPAPISCELGDTDMDGYIALVGKANICCFKNLKIRPLNNNDVTKVTAEKIISESPEINADVGTDTSEISGLPKTVRVKAADGVIYTAPIEWDFDGYNRYKRGKYTVTGILSDSLLENHIKLYGNGVTLKGVINVTGDKDLIDENTVKFDFNGKSEITENFECYYSSIFSDALKKSDSMKTWEIADGRLHRIDNKFSVKSSGEWSWEKAKTEMSSLVYKGRKYENFELTVDFQRASNTYYWAMIGFGIDDPAAYPLDIGSGILAYLEQEGRPLFWGNDVSAGHTTPYENFEYTGRHTMKLTVKDGIAEMSVDGREPVLKTIIPDEYRGGGYISITTNMNAAYFDNLSITALPDTEEYNTEGFSPDNYPALHSVLKEADAEDTYTYSNGNGANYPKTGDNGKYRLISIFTLTVSMAYLAAVGYFKIFKKRKER